MRYTYLGDLFTDPALVGAQCDPVLRANGKCVVSIRMAAQLVLFAGEERPRVVARRRLRVNRDRETPQKVLDLMQALKDSLSKTTT